MTAGLSHIVRGFRDRIQRGGGSVVVGASGDVTVRSASGQNLTFRNDAGSASILVSSGGVITLNGATTVASTLTVSGTGTHTFSGPVKVSLVGGTQRLSLDATDASYTSLIRATRSGSGRQSIDLNTVNDLVFYASIDGSTYTEALRVSNATNYVSAAVRFGVGTAVPGYPLEVAGSIYMSGGTAGFGTTPNGSYRLWSMANNTAVSAGIFSQAVASATAPVLVVKLGATPGSGGHAQEWQTSVGAAVTRVTSAGSVQATAPILVYSASFAGALGGINVSGQLYVVAANTQSTIGAAGAATALPANPVGYAKVDVNGTVYAMPYYNAA